MITSDERAAMRETVATLNAAAEVGDPTRPLLDERTTLALLVQVATQVPRLLDALDTAEARQIAALGRLKTAKDEVRRVDNFLRLEREAARENLARAEKAEAEVARLREEAARPAPAWDGDTVRAEAIRAVESVPATTTFSWPHAVDVILAVVREHLPVSGESRATLARAWDEGYRTCDRAWEETADLTTPDEDRTDPRNPYREEADRD